MWDDDVALPSPIRKLTLEIVVNALRKHGHIFILPEALQVGSALFADWCKTGTAPLHSIKSNPGMTQSLSMFRLFRSFRWYYTLYGRYVQNDQVFAAFGGVGRENRGGVLAFHREAGGI